MRKGRAGMGFFSGIARAIDFFNDVQDSTQSYEQGENWAEKVIEHHGNRMTLDYEVDEDSVQDVAEECAKDPDSFYEGFRNTWDPYVKEVEPHRDGLLGNLGRFLFQ